ncbi:hypothetical protein CDAR_539601 [Caerostris darwini]|uniref:Uncharacterized protein n=1 Tax=Caerostris darwini TaxID=1538125 RepID=A0AAV4MYE3_9ARAC|nr:hypothetical protein CDAR_539601 [Caerostris darwini]
MLRVFKTFPKSVCCMGVKEGGGSCRFPIRWDSNTCPGEPHLLERAYWTCNSQMVTERASAARAGCFLLPIGVPPLPVSLSHFDITVNSGRVGVTIFGEHSPS